jgi:hypothetical protein
MATPWRQRLGDILGGVLIAIAVASLGTLMNTWRDFGIIQELVSESVKVQKDLQSAITDLRVEMSRITEKYVTREEMERYVDKRTGG